MEEIEYKETIIAMDVRTWMAGMALAGLCANEMVSSKGSDLAYKNKWDDRMAGAYFAEIAVAIADATLAELAKEKPE